MSGALSQQQPENGASVPLRDASFSGSRDDREKRFTQIIIEIADHEFEETLTPAKLREFDWQLFQLSDAFIAKPCDRALFEKLADLAAQPGFRWTMSDSYSYYLRSEKHVTDEGAASPESRTHFIRFMGLYSKWPKDEVVKQFCCNYSVHPLHRPAFEALYDGQAAAKP